MIAVCRSPRGSRSGRSSGESYAETLRQLDPEARVEVAAIADPASLAADYEAGLANSLRSAAPTFSWQDVTADGAVLQTFDHPDNFVHVDTGATLTTPSGGRVFLLAREATNAGRIDTPGGQTVLAAGREVVVSRGQMVEIGAGEWQLAEAPERLAATYTITATKVAPET